MKNWICVLFVLVISFHGRWAHGQVSTPPGPKPTVTTDIRFAPLLSAEVVSRPNGGFVIQQVSKPINCTLNPKGLVPGYTINHYYWSGLDFGPNGPPDSPTASGVVHNPGKVTVSCNLEIVANTPGAVPFGTLAYISKPIYAVGGPLALGTFNGYPGTPTRDSDSHSPVYLEYFGFDPSATTPVGAQNPQHGSVTAYGQQPTGTTYAWSVPGQLKILTTGVTPSSSSINVGATSGSAGSPIVVSVKYIFNNNDPQDPVTGSCDDNSPQQVNSDGSSDALAYKFDSHKPAYFEDVAQTAYHDVHNGPPNFTDWGCATEYLYQLKDDGDTNMGFVYIVERWAVNFNNQSFYIWNQNGPSPTGLIVDSFFLYTNGPHPYNNGLGTPYAGPYTHKYYAATTDTSYIAPGLSGILIKTTNTTYWTDVIKNQ
jgi:hypothetical protein